MAWVSLEGCSECWQSGIPKHHSFLPVLASPGAGGELGLLKEQDLERMCVVSLVPKKESSESFQMLSEPFHCCVPGAPCHGHHRPHPLPQCCGQCLCWVCWCQPWARCQGDGDTQLQCPLEGDSSPFFPPWNRASPVAEPQLLHWPTRRCGANDSDEDEGLISTGRVGKREKRERVFHCKKIDTTSPRQSRSAASPSARRHAHCA